MQALLIKLANITVMIHMALGCAWHHGLASPHACNASGVSVESDCDHETSQCDGDSGHHDQQCPGDDHQRPFDGELVCAPGCDGNHPHDHSTCRDDRCSFNQTNVNDRDYIVDLNEYLGGVCTEVIAVRSHIEPEKSFENVRSGPNAAPDLRAHLLLCVLIL